eukprot:g6865.t1
MASYATDEFNGIVAPNRQRVDAVNNGEADPNIADKYGDNALHLAAQFNKKDTKVIELLLTNMPLTSINKKGGFGETPLGYAYKYNKSPIQQKIIDLIHSKGGRRKRELSNLHNAIESENMELFRKCMNEDSISIMAYMSNDPEKSLLRYAIDVSNINIYKTLANDKRINQNNEEFEINGKTNLHYICELEFDELKQEKHLELTKHIYHQIKPTYRDRVERDRYAIVRHICSWPLVVKWAKTLGTKFQRYKIMNEEEPIHQSLTSIVFFATDVKDNNNKVALKLMKNYDEFEREIISRFNNSNNQTIDKCVVKVLGWHVPNDNNAPSIQTNKRDNATQSNFHGDKPYVLVMERGSKSLFHQLVTQRIAGCSVDKVINIFQQAVDKVKELHDLGYIHCDLKPRNFLYVKRDGIKEEQLLLCDMDAACEKDSQRDNSLKYSTGYCPPELARCIFTTNGGKLDKIKTSFDVWSLGVLLYEICTGQPLFHQDISDDNLANKPDKAILC